MDCPPGAHVRYSSIGYIILGYIIERVSGVKYEEYVTENIFKPLKMYNTSFYLSDFKFRQLATPYILYGSFFGFNIPIPSLYIRLNCFNSMGGMFTTLEDLSHLFIVHMNKGVYNGVRILNESTIEMMHTIQHPERDNFLWNLYYGLGWMITDEFVGRTQRHGGIFLGYFGCMMMNASTNVGVIFLGNQNIKSFKESKYNEFFVKAYKAIGKLLLERAEEIEP